MCKDGTFKNNVNSFITTWSKFKAREHLPKSFQHLYEATIVGYNSFLPFQVHSKAEVSFGLGWKGSNCKETQGIILATDAGSVVYWKHLK